jgi:Holliday junction resolvasome RuvABC DNA-binding subunit
LSSLCSAHHAAVHEGRLVIEGKPSTGLTFKHADGTIYGGKPRPVMTAAAADAFVALKTLGYKEKEARFAITRALAHVGQGAMGLEDLIRRGLAALRAGS